MFIPATEESPHASELVVVRLSLSGFCNCRVVNSVGQHEDTLGKCTAWSGIGVVICGRGKYSAPERSELLVCKHRSDQNDTSAPVEFQCGNCRPAQGVWMRCSARSPKARKVDARPFADHKQTSASPSKLPGACSTRQHQDSTA